MFQKDVPYAWLYHFNLLNIALTRRREDKKFNNSYHPNNKKNKKK